MAAVATRAAPAATSIVSVAPELPPRPPRTPPGTRAVELAVGTVVGVGVGVLVAPPVIVRLTFREVPVEPHANVTAYTAPRRASVSMVAVAVVLPLGMVVVSKMPEVTVVSPVQPMRRRG